MLTAEYISDKISAFVQSEIKVYPCNKKGKKLGKY